MESQHNKAGKLYTWGSNESGQLGFEGDVKRATPFQVSTPRAVKFTWVEANGSHSVAISGTCATYVYLMVQMIVLCTVGGWVHLAD